MTGPTGIGRTALISTIRGALADRGDRCVLVRCHAGQVTAEYGLLYRVLHAIAPDGGAAVGPILDLLARVSAAGIPPNGRELIRRVAEALRKELALNGPLVVLVDDLHDADPATKRILGPLLVEMAGAPLRLVSTMRANLTRAGEEIPGCGLGRRLALPELSVRDVGRMLGRLLDAEPEPELTERVFARSGGNPLAVAVAVECLGRGDVIRVVDRHAFLLRRHPRAVLPHNHEVPPSTHDVLRQVRAAGAEGWAVASALSVLAPLGPIATELVAETGLVGVKQARAGVHALVDQGVLALSEHAVTLRPPVLADVLRGLLSPVDCERVNAVAARAILTQRAEPPDEDFLPDCLAACGGSAVPEQAGKLLLAASERVIASDNHRAARWSGVAVSLLTGVDRQLARHLHAHACLVAGRADEASAMARRALTEAVTTDRRDDTELWQLTNVLVRGICGSGDRQALEDFVSHDWDTLPVPPHWRSIGRAMALLQLGRSGEMFDEITRHRALWAADPAVAASGEVTTAAALIGCGRRQEFDANVLGRQDNTTRVARLTLEHSLLQYALGRILFGDLTEARQALGQAGLTAEDIEFGIRLEYDFQSGDWDHALAVARRKQAEWGTSPPPFTMAQLRTVPPRILASRGRFGAARQWLELGTDDLVDGGMHAQTTAVVEVLLGDSHLAVPRLRAVQERSSRGSRSLHLGEVLWTLAVACENVGDHAGAVKALADLEDLADKQQFDRTELYRLLARTRVHGPGPHVHDALRLAKERAQPFETAVACLVAAPHLDRPGPTLTLAYELFGRLDALPWRAAVRSAMRAAGIAVPSRAESTEEADRLLACLVADGFGNQQVAHVLGTSRKAVEGRVTRMLRRAGLRSRVELATAILRGETPWLQR